MKHFTYIDVDSWKRKEHFYHFLEATPCTYSMTTSIPITPIITKKKHIYSTMIHCITTAVNQFKEFRTALDPQNSKPGIFDTMHPSYTIFHKETETFSNIWTKYSETYADFYQSYKHDIAQFGESLSMNAKPDIPDNTFSISMMPWESFEGFSLHLQKGYHYLLPIFTIGKYYKRDNEYLIPLAIQAHHAACDGFHLCAYITYLKNLITNL